MATLAELLGNFAPPHKLTHDGKVYHFAHFDMSVRAALEKAYFQRARETLSLIKTDLGDEEYARCLDRVVAEFRRGTYAFPGGESREFYFSVAGMPELLTHVVTLEDGKPLTLGEATDLYDDATVEVTQLAMVVFLDSFPNVKARLLKAEKAGQEEGKAIARLLSQLTSAN